MGCPGRLDARGRLLLPMRAAFCIRAVIRVPNNFTNPARFRYQGKEYQAPGEFVCRGDYGQFCNPLPYMLAGRVNRDLRVWAALPGSATAGMPHPKLDTLLRSPPRHLRYMPPLVIQDQG
jgi:hypothetical protein